MDVWGYDNTYCFLPAIKAIVLNVCCIVICVTGDWLIWVFGEMTIPIVSYLQ